LLITDSSLALPLFFYSDRELQRKMIFPIDFDAIHASEADDSGEQNLWAGRSQGVFPFRICEPAALDVEHVPYLVVSRPDGWLPTLLRAEGAGTAVLPDRQPGQWYALGGVFSPVAHPETRLLRVTPKE
jgi:hypothetical protein